MRSTGSALALSLLACQSAEIEPSGDPVQSAEESSDAGVTSDDGPSAIRGAACTKLCQLVRVLSMPCTTGAVVVSGKFYPPAEDAAAVPSDGAVDDASGAEVEPDCMSDCLHSEDASAKCDPAFDSLIDCFAATIWRCTRSQGWSPVDCSTQWDDHVECTDS